MKKIFSVVVFMILWTQISAQQEKCGFSLAQRYLERMYPAYYDAMQMHLRDLQSEKYKLTQNSRNEIFRVPVVIHVVHNATEENIADSLIISQMEVINEDFRRQNPNAADIRDIFRDVVGDARIEFELKEIRRVKTTSLFSVSLLTGELPDNVKQTSAGGSNAADPTNFLNIWICKIQPIAFGPLVLGQILGYAYPPMGLPNWPDGVSAPSPGLDGVVLDYRMIGRRSPFTIDPGTGTPIRGMGRTATHEIGHYLGLRHVWGDGGDIFGTEDSCNEDDGIEDTPNTGAQSNFSCDKTVNSCDEGPGDLPDMVENFMDYAAEDCQNSFTIGQIALMRSVLLNQRCDLVDACQTTSANNENAPLVRITPTLLDQGQQLEISHPYDQDVKLSIYNQMGQMMMQQHINEKNVRVTLSNISSGLYVAVLHYKNRQFVQKIQIR